MDWELIDAAKRGNNERLRDAIKKGANVNAHEPGINGRTALIWASGIGHTEIVRELLSSGANVSQENNSGHTALIWAARNDHTGTVRELLSLGANVNLQNSDRYTALIFAARNGHTDTVRELLSSGVNVNQQINDGYTALIHAARFGHTDTVRELLLSGANVNQENKNGHTALIWATRNGHTETVRELVSSGANVNQENNGGYTALICAVMNGHTETVRELLTLGANVNQEDNHGKTALRWAIEVLRPDSPIVQLLEEIVKDNRQLSPIPHPVSIPVLPENWEKVTNEMKGMLYRNSKTSEERTSPPVGYPLLHDPSYPEVTFFDEPQEAVLSSSGGHVDFDNGAEITVPPDAVQPGSTISVKVQPSFSPKDVFVMPSDIHSASASYLITSTGSKLNKDMTITLKHHVNTDEDASNLLFLQASATPTMSDSSHVYEYKTIPDSDTKEDFPRGENKFGLQRKVKTWFDGSRSLRIATKDKLLQPASPERQLSHLNHYTVRVYRSPLHTTGDRVAIVAVCLYGRLYAKFLKKLDNVLIPRDYPEVSSRAIDRTICGPYSFTEPEAKLTVVSAPLGWTVSPDTDTVSKCVVDFPETGNFRQEELYNYPPRIVCRFYPNDQALQRSTCTLSFTGFDKEVKINVPLKAPIPHVQKKMDTRILQEAAESLRTTAVQLKEVQVVPTVNNILSLIDMMTKGLNSSSTLEVLATQVDLIKSEVQTILHISRKVIEGCTIWRITDDFEANLSKIEVLSHQLCLVTKVKLKHCQDQSEKAAALNDVMNNGAQLMNSVGCLLNLMHTLNEVTPSGTKQLHQSGPPSIARKTKRVEIRL